MWFSGGTYRLLEGETSQKVVTWKANGLEEWELHGPGSILLPMANTNVGST